MTHANDKIKPPQYSIIYIQKKKRNTSNVQLNSNFHNFSALFYFRFLICIRTRTNNIYFNIIQLAGIHSLEQQIYFCIRKILLAIRATNVCYPHSVRRELSRCTRHFCFSLRYGQRCCAMYFRRSAA